MRGTEDSDAFIDGGGVNGQEAVMRMALRGISQGHLNLHGIPDVASLTEQLKSYRSQLPVGDVLKEVRLPNEVAPVTPVRPRKSSRHRKASAKIAD